MKRTLHTVIAALVLALSLTALMLAPTSVHPVAAISLEPEAQAEPRAFTTLDLSLDGGNGEVRTTVKNTFTLFPSTVEVVLHLYSSPIMTETVEEMTYMSGIITPDLDIGKSITTSASTGGETLYWVAHVSYRSNGGEWKTLRTACTKFNGNGERV